MLLKLKMTTGEIIWYGLIVMAIVFSAIEAPINFVLKIPVNINSVKVDAILSGLFLIDILYSLKKFGRRFDMYFYIDVIATIPFDIITFSFGLPGAFSILRLLRIFRIMKMIKMFSTIGNITLIPAPVKVPLITAGSFILVNFIACAWIEINDFSGTPFLIYTDALYWAITTLTTIGYGDITPTTVGSKVFTMFVMISGVGVYGLVIGTFSKLIAASAHYKEKLKERISDLSIFMDYYDIPNHLREATYDYYNHLLNERLSTDDHKIISELPMVIQSELKMFINIKLIKPIQIFKNCSHECLEDVARCLEQQIYPPGRFIIKKGDIGNEMFIIEHGMVEVLRHGKPVATLNDGKFFGETALLKETTRNADIVSKNYCEVIVLEKGDFLKLIKKHPLLLKNMEQYMS